MSGTYLKDQITKELLCAISKEGIAGGGGGLRVKFTARISNVLHLPFGTFGGSKSMATKVRVFEEEVSTIIWDVFVTCFA